MYRSKGALWSRDGLRTLVYMRVFRWSAMLGDLRRWYNRRSVLLEQYLDFGLLAVKAPDVPGYDCMSNHFLVAESSSRSTLDVS